MSNVWSGIFYASATALLFAVGASATKADGAGYSIIGQTFGSAISSEEIAAYGPVAIDHFGRGLPPGSGSYEEGKTVYSESCSSCHGANMQGVADLSDMPSGRSLALVGGRGTLTSETPRRTVESFWPYATTLFDYVRRAMPYHSPGSLTDKQVYAVVAYILAEGNIIDKKTQMNSETLPKVKMPNAEGFISENKRLEIYK